MSRKNLSTVKEEEELHIKLLPSTVNCFAASDSDLYAVEEEEENLVLPPPQEGGGNGWGPPDEGVVWLNRSSSSSSSSSPPPDVNKRPSYLEAAIPKPKPGYFDAGVIRKLEQQFNDVADESRVEMEISIPIPPLHPPKDEEEEGKDVERVKTYLRIKPYVKKDPSEVSALEVIDDQTVVANSFIKKVNGTVLNRRLEFKFSKVFGSEYTQQEIYEHSVAPLLDKFNSGENVLVFSYGATNSGKTFTMRGSAAEHGYGIVPRTLYHLCEMYEGRIYPEANIQPFRQESTRELTEPEINAILEKKQKLLGSVKSDSAEMGDRKRGRESDLSSYCPSMRYLAVRAHNGDTEDQTIMYSIWISFVELYNEKIFDVFQDSKRNEVKMVCDKGGAAVFKDVVEIPVFSEEEAFAIYQAGCRKLAISATGANSTSSRSHSFFTLRIVELGKSERSKRVFPMKVHRMTFSDLAGNERMSDTGNTGQQLRESNQINNSLLSLLKVIRMIRDFQSQIHRKSTQGILERIPFRESKLTRVFQTYFTSSTHIAMFVNVNASPKMMDVSLNTLKGSAIASQIVAYRPRTSFQSLVVKHIPANKDSESAACLHSSMDLEDVIELTEDETDTDDHDSNAENQPIHVFKAPLPRQKPKGAVGPQKRPRNAPGILREKQQVPLPRKTLAINNATKKKHPISPKLAVKKPKSKQLPTPTRTEAEYQAVSSELELANSYQHQLLEAIAIRDAQIAQLVHRIRVVEVETRENVLREVGKGLNEPPPEHRHGQERQRVILVDSQTQTENNN